MDVAGDCPHAGIRGRNHDFLDATAVETGSRAARLCGVGAERYGVPVAEAICGLVRGDGVGDHDEATGICAMREDDSDFAAGEEADVESVVTVARTGVRFGEGGEAARG